MKNNKAQVTMAFLIILLLILIAVVIVLKIVGDGIKENQDNNDEPLENHVDVCHYSYFDIIYVDGFYLNNCYAFRNTNSSENEWLTYDLNRSFNQQQSAYEYFISKDWKCREIRTLGEVYCLKDKSECLFIEGKICNLIKLETK